MRLVGLIGALGLLVVAAAAVAEDEPPSAQLAAQCANGANKAACTAYLTARAAEVFGGGTPGAEAPPDPDAQTAAARAALGQALQGGAAPAGSAEER